MTEAEQQHKFLTGAMLLVVLLTAWVNPGNLGNVDATRRLRVAHSWWTSTPEVLPQEYPGYGSPGRGGVLRGVYGVGHSLILLPADLLVTPVVERMRLPAAGREAAIAFLTQALIGMLLVQAAYRLLRRLGFTHSEAGLGTLSLLLLTTALHYLQNAQENLLMTALAMGGTASLLKWREEGDSRALLAAGGMFGFSLLVRLTTLADLGAAVLMLILLEGRKVWRAAPRLAWSYGAFVAVERAVQYLRFGNWTRTYYSGIMAQETTRPGTPDVFLIPFWDGVAAALIYPRDCIFQFDPLLTLTLVLLVLFWRRLSGPIRCYSLGAAASLTVYVLFYATYQSPTGEASWGDRYVTTPVLLLALLAVPLMLRLEGRIPVWGWVVVAWSFALQVASLALIMSIEWLQAVRAHIDSSISLRIQNIWLVWTGQAAGSDWLREFPVEWRTWNFLPFQMTLRYAGLAKWAIAGWWVMGVLWVGQTLRLLRQVRVGRGSG